MGDRQLADERGVPAEAPAPAAARGSAEPTQGLPTGELLREATRDIEELVKSHLALAKAELRADLKAETKMATGLGVAALAAFISVNLLFVTAVLALSRVLSAWEAGLVVTGGTLVIAGIAGAVGWKNRVRSPLERSRRQLKKDVKWTKERTA